MFRYLTASVYLKNIITLFTGGASAQLISILAIPFLTRIFPPETFGELSIIQTYASIIAVFLFLGFEQAIPTAKNNNDKNSLLSLIIISSGITFIGLGAALLIILFYSPDLFSFQPFNLWPYIVITTVFIALNQFSIQGSIHSSLFKEQAISQIIYILSRLLMTFLLFSFIGNNSLIWGFIGGFIFSIGYIIYYLYKAHFFQSLSLGQASIQSGLIKYKGFFLYNLPSTLINIFLISFPILYMSNLYDIAFIGFVGIVYRLVVAPLSLVNKSIGQVFYNRITEPQAKVEENIQFFFKNLLLLSSSFPFFIILYIWGETLFTILLGEAWKSLGTIAAIIVPYIYLSFCVSPLSSIFMAYNKNNIFFIINVVFVIFTIGYFNIGFDQSLDGYIFLKNYTLIMVGYYLIILATLFLILKRHETT